MADTILIVDDDRRVRELLAVILEQAGYEVLLAPDGPAAVALLLRHSPALVVLEWAIPDRAGPRLVETLQRGGPRPRPPVLVLTLDPRGRTEAAELGIQAYLTKPFGLPTLLNEVHRLVAGPASDRPPPSAAVRFSSPIPAADPPLYSSAWPGR